METCHVYILYVGKSSTNGSPEGIGHEIVIVANRQLQTHSHWFPFTKGISNPGGARPVHLEWWRGSAATLPGRYCTFPTLCSQHSWSFLDTASSLRRQNGSITSLSLGYPSEKKSGTTMWIQKRIHLARWTMVSGWQVRRKGQIGPAMRMNRLQTWVYFYAWNIPLLDPDPYLPEGLNWERARAALTISSRYLKINGASNWWSDDVWQFLAFSSWSSTKHLEAPRVWNASRLI